MQVLRDEDVDAEHGERREGIRADGCCETGLSEQVNVQQRVVDATLAAQEGHGSQQCNGGHHTGREARLAFCHPLEHGDAAECGHQGKQHAAQIKPAGVCVAVFRQQERTDHQQQQHHRHRRPEDGRPGEVLQDHTAHQRANGAADRIAGDPDADGDAPLAFVAEHVGDERKRGRRQGGPRNAQQGAGGDQRLCRGGQRCGHRGSGKCGGPNEQQPPPPELVAQRAHRDQKACHHEAIDIDDPEQL